MESCSAVGGDPHDVVLTELASGAVYVLCVQVMGVRNQTTEWSEQVSHMAT